MYSDASEDHNPRIIGARVYKVNEFVNRSRALASVVARLRYLSVLVALVLVGCAQYASTWTVRPKYYPNRLTAGELARTEQRIIKGLRQKERRPLEAMGEFLAAAHSAQQQLAREPANMMARKAYNFAIARTIGTFQQAKLDPWAQPLRVPALGGDFVLVHKPDPDPYWQPTRYDLIPADQLGIKGAFVREHQQKEGIGAPLVAIERHMNERAQRDFVMPKLYYGVTALIRFEDRRAVVAFEDPLATERVTLAERSFPLAADFTAPIAVLLAQQNPAKLGLPRLLRPDKYAKTTQVARSRPYDPNKRVVLIIHGLMDSPATWVPMINHLQADEQLRQNYQVWFYSYPTGYPYPHSAAILRRQLDAIERRFPLRKKMVVIGHSMGGCISRLLITDTGDMLWREIFKKPPEDTAMPADSKALLREELIFRHRPEIGRVIFIAAPLRGSELASSSLGRVGSTFVKFRSKLLKVGVDAISVLKFQGDELRLKRAPNSVDLLAPNNRFVLAIETIPLTPGIPHHVICGDRGKGGNKDKRKPVMSDGVVPYWSSHMQTAESRAHRPVRPRRAPKPTSHRGGRAHSQTARTPMMLMT